MSPFVSDRPRTVSVAKAADKADNSKLFSGPELRWSASRSCNMELGCRAECDERHHYRDQVRCARRFGRHFELGRMCRKVARRWRLQEAISRR